jgi:hypothetical protein
MRLKTAMAKSKTLIVETLWQLGLSDLRVCCGSRDRWFPVTAPYLKLGAVQRKTVKL